ncbi:MAG TPA: ribosome small subunit-dependent GTPase A, partial [Desulfobacteraceae bacterium]|nr:ribosome small subunit-dependent GTPase A [Desulfobacteraceae bacterium]
MKKKKKTSEQPLPESKGVIVAHYGIAVEVLFDSGERSKVK